MGNQFIDQYRDAIDWYDNRKLTSDDLMLEKKIDKFYKTPTQANHSEIVAYLRDKAISSNATTLAETLDDMMKLEQTTESVPASKPVAITIPDNMVPPSILPPKTEIKAIAEPSPDVKSKEGGEALHLEEPVAASVPVPENVFYIDPNAEVNIHKFAAEFPLMEGDEYEQFKGSIKLGQQSPVIMLNGELLDGRNRLKACRELGIKTMAVEYRGEKTAEELITDLNIHRRHLTPGQRAAYGLRLLPVLEHEAKERKNAGVADHSESIRSGRAVDLAGAQVGVNGRYVEDAKKIAESSPELFQKLINGEVTVPEAKKQIRALAPTPVPPEHKQYSITEAVIRILELIQDDAADELEAIAKESPPAIRKAIQMRLKEPAVTTENEKIVIDPVEVVEDEKIIQQGSLF